MSVLPTQSVDPLLRMTGLPRLPEAAPPVQMREIEPDRATAAAYKFCEDLAANHYENFPIGSVLLPPRVRSHVCAVYAFARLSDDFADEPEFAGQRRERLAEWRDMLRDAEAGRPARHPAFQALRHTLRVHQLPAQWLHDLITAFEMDCEHPSWRDWDELMFYCKHSANPMGRLFLWLFGYRDDWRFRTSDCICTALQLANFWQDVSVDWKKDRIYVPEADLKAFGLTRDDFAYMSTQPSNATDKRLVPVFQEMAKRTWALFEAGRPLADTLVGRLKLEIRLSWLGGTMILRSVEATGFNVFHRPTIRKSNWARLVWKSLWPLTEPVYGQNGSC